jgi:hypothetical protein
VNPQDAEANPDFSESAKVLLRVFFCKIRIVSENASFHFERGWMNLLENDFKKLGLMQQTKRFQLPDSRIPKSLKSGQENDLCYYLSQLTFIILEKNEIEGGSKEKKI